MAKEKIKKIIIIGSNSFSAGSLIQFLLKKNYKIYGISRSKMNKEIFLRNLQNEIYSELDILN